MTQLAPNKDDILAHLMALFPPSFVHKYPDARIEVAYGAPDAGPDKAEWFSAFALGEAADFAAARNAKGNNVYVGAALRRGDVAPFGRSSDEDFLAACHAWIDLDGAGDCARAHAALKELELQPSIVVTTGTLPHMRLHAYFAIQGGAADGDRLRHANAALRERLGGDAVQNPGRVLRLAGTVNYPSAKKRQERGYLDELVTLDARAVPPRQIEWLLGLGTGKTAGDKSKRGRTDDELVALLEATRTPGRWHVHMRSAIATMVGRGWDDTQIRLACASYCDRGAPDHDLTPLINGARRKWDKPEPDEAEACTTLADFVAYMPQHSYIFKPSGEMWPAGSVNARIPPIGKTSASAWLDKNSAVEQMTWAPGEPQLIRGRLISDGGWMKRDDCTVFNLYRPPTLIPKSGSAQRWLDHIARVYPDDADHIVKWLAHRVQKPQEKLNHALVLGGTQGIGKDTLLEPVKHAIGPWNFAEVSPQHMLGRFNSFLKSVILRVSEARDLGDVDRFAFYDHMKAYTASPPDVLRVDEKHVRAYPVFNLCGVIITSNHKTDGIYLPADDRRHYVAWSTLRKEEFDECYWRDLYRWYATEGNEQVADYLQGMNLSDFDAKAPPAKTPAFWEIVDASRSPEDAEMADALEALGQPDIVTVSKLIFEANDDFADWLRDRRNARRIPHRLEECGYVAIRNENSQDGRWKLNGRNQVLYGKASMSIHDRTAAAWRMTGAR